MERSGSSSGELVCRPRPSGPAFPGPTSYASMPSNSWPPTSSRSRPPGWSGSTSSSSSRSGAGASTSLAAPATRRPVGWCNRPAIWPGRCSRKADARSSSYATGTPSFRPPSTPSSAARAWGSFGSRSALRGRMPLPNAGWEPFALDHLLIFGRRHLEHVLREFVDHYQRARPHQSLDQRVPDSPIHYATQRAGPVVRRDCLGGLIHEYSRAV